MEKRLIGILGEKLVCKWYSDRGYQLLTKNFRTRFGEIDIIAKDKNTIVFIEVKARKNASFYQAREAVTYSKQQKIKQTALRYLAEHSEYADFNARFDVAEVYSADINPTINIIENAFE